MAGYVAQKSYAQLLSAIQNRVGEVIEDAEFRLKHLDGTDVTPAKNIFGSATGPALGTNPALSDFDGYPNPYYRHGDYIAQWTAFGDVTSRVIRIPPAFEDFGMVDATKYDGIDPTGATDCSAGINQAILECAGKFILFFPPGDYLIAFRCTPVSDTYILGAGPHLTRFISTAGATGAMFFDGGVTPANNVTFDRVCVDGYGVGRSAVNPNLKFSGNSYNVVVKNSWIINAPVVTSQGGMHIQMESHDSVVENCVVGGGGIDGIWIANTERNRIQNNLIYDTGDDGISMWGAKRANVSGNILSNMNAIAGGRINGRGIVLGETEHCVISNNYIEGWERACIGLDQAGQSFDNQISGNVLAFGGANSNSGTFGNGLLLRLPAGETAIERNNITGNLILDPARSGIYILVEGTGGLVQHFNIHNNMIIDGGTNPNHDNTGRGIRIESTGAGVTSKIKHTSIAGNYIFGFPSEGIRAVGQASNYLEGIYIDNNHIYDSGDVFTSVDADAIRLDYVDGFSVRNNRGADLQPVGDSQKGCSISHPGVGVVIITNNDFVNSKTYRYNLTEFDNIAYLVFSNNAGFNPLAGRTTIPVGTWTAIGNGNYKKTQTITYSSGFLVNSAQLLPKVTATCSVAGWTAAVTAITDSGFTVDIVASNTDPSGVGSGTLHWRVDF